MSHLGIYKTSIKKADTEIAKRAVMLVAREFGVSVKSSFIGYRNRMHKCIAGFNCQEIPFGIGVRIDNKGKLEIVGDSYRSKIFDDVTQAIEDRYKTIVFARGLKKLGYTVQTKQNKQKQEIILEAIK